MHEVDLHPSHIRRKYSERVKIVENSVGYARKAKFQQRLLYGKLSPTTKKSQTRAGVYEILCPKHMLVPKDNLITMMLYYTKCQS